MKNLLSGIIITIGFVNMALFVVWLNIVTIEAQTEEMSSHIYNSISLQFTILEIILATVAFGTAVAAIFGYQAIKNGAQTKAEETAQEYLQENGESLIRAEVNRVIVLTRPASYGLERADQGTIEAEQEENNV